MAQWKSAGLEVKGLLVPISLEALCYVFIFCLDLVQPRKCSDKSCLIWVCSVCKSVKRRLYEVKG